MRKISLFFPVHILNDLTSWLGGSSEKCVWKKYKELYRQEPLCDPRRSVVYWKIVNLLRFIHSTKIHGEGYYVPGSVVVGPGYIATNKMNAVPDLTAIV